MITGHANAIGSPRATGIILGLLEQRTGQRIDSNRSWRIETALKPLLRDLGLASIDQLASALGDGTSPGLSDSIVDALLNQETSFFRDANVLEMIADVVARLQAEEPDRRMRVWSAGCSTGQEPLSLAMLFAEAETKGGAAAPEIQASDISAQAIERARRGTFSQFEIQRGLPVRRMVTWFDDRDGQWVAKPELMRRISFRRHNLVDQPPLPGRFDLILCRNVLLYFAAPVRQRVLASLASALRPGGLLMLGAGETVIGQTDLLQPSVTYRGLYELSR